ncbi:hypothetical protein [Pseudoalteromonas sp. R3]|uniref:hypothetical protein n=1 Tax=Pseudoalteromonas sp. R3 TaxID=1709477 RepID=UPI000A50EA1C|nr:hypothetical protein [Pseudoalteromonas sp. R3]AZZ96607.1 hypothetical protein ELR70_05185 [Pseudoalteromonas sp. R3]
MNWFYLCVVLLMLVGYLPHGNAQQTSGSNFNEYGPQLPRHAKGIHLKGNQDQLSWPGVSGATYYYVEAYKGHEVYQARHDSAIRDGIMGNDTQAFSQVAAASAGFSGSGAAIIRRYKSYSTSFTLDAPFADARYLIIPCNQLDCGAGFVAELYDAQQYHLGIETFQTDKLTVLPWEQAQLSWDVAGAYRVTLLKNGRSYRTGLPNKGSEAVKLEQSALFTLRAEGHNRRVVEKQVQLVFQQVDDPDTLHHGAYSVRLQSLGLDPVPRTVVAVDDKYLFLVDKQNALHKIDHRPAQAKVVWTQQLSGKVLNRPLVFSSGLYFGVSKLDGSGEVCRVSVYYSTSARCKTTSDGVVAGAAVVRRTSTVSQPIDGPFGVGTMTALPPVPLNDYGIVFIDNKGLIMEYDRALSKLYQSAYLPDQMRESASIVTPSADAQARTLYLPFVKSSTGQRSVAAISIDDPGAIDDTTPGGPIDPGGPILPVDPRDPIGPGNPIDLFSVPMRLPTEQQLARDIQNAAYNENMITVEWVHDTGAGNE